MISLEEMNRVVRRFGENQKAFMRSEQRTSLRSMLFDVPRRSSLGWHCFYTAAVPLLRELTQHITPEEIGRRMKRLCSRPYYLTLSILLCSYFNARQQALLDNHCSSGDPLPDETPEKIEAARFLVDFWARACRTYRTDGTLLPADAEYTQCILQPEAVAELARRLRPSTDAVRHAVRRLAASLELYSFILHGEQRDGIFAHGPYPQADNTIIVVHEFNDLQNEFLPWAATAVRNKYPNIAIVLRLKDVRTRFDLFGSILYDPREVSDHVVDEALLAVDHRGKIQAIDFKEIADIQHRAAEAQNELYLRASEWSPRFKAEYGVHLFANHMRAFFHPAGLNRDDEIRNAFMIAADAVIDRMLRDPEPPSMWSFMATTQGDFFWPVGSAGNSDFDITQSL